MGKVETGIYCCFAADIFDKSFTKMFLEYSLPNMYMIFFQTAEFDWFPGFVAMATTNVKFAKKYSKIIFLEAIRGMKLKLYRNVHNICLYKKIFFIAVAHVHLSVWRLKVSIDL